MPGALSACERCARPSPDLRPLAAALRWPAVLASSFLHAGLWAGDALKGRLCPSCRRRAGLLCATAAALAAAALAAGAATLLRAARS